MNSPLKKNSRIYVAGHTGLVGGAIVRELRKMGYTDLILKTHKELELLDAPKVSKLFETEGVEYVIDAAARVGGIKANMTYPADFLYENLHIQNNLMWSALKHGVKKFIFLGSSCAYPKHSPQPMKEEYMLDGKPEPTNEGYALAKIAGIKLCEKIYEQYGKTFISCMPTNIYGVGDTIDPEASHVIPALVRRMHEAKEKGVKEVTIWGSGNTRREFLYVDDLAQAVVWMLEKYNEKQFLNIGTGEDVSIKELAALIKEVVGFKGRLMYDTTKPDGMQRKLLDVSRITSFGWRPQVSLSDGLRLFYQWFKKEVKD